MNRRPLRWSAVACLALLPAVGAAADAVPARPNILWITCEDMSPHLGCYGDTYAKSPTIDRLAAEGVRYTNCFTHIGVCAPSRSGLITGMYPPSIGSHHMRSSTVLADYIKCYPQYLREAGYYTTNNSKTDYNFNAPKETWNESSNKAHWKNRPDGKPFFAIFNYTTTHESQIRAGKKQMTAADGYDPAKVAVPPYHPDTPVVRNDWARYYENIEKMDRQVAASLKELDDAGLTDDTIVFFYSDHGAGMPRSKRWLYDSSLRVPLIVRYPKKWQTDATKAGTVSDELVAFVDLGPTAMSLAGVPTPKHMQGQAFLGPHRAAAPREYVYGCRDRMDERVDMIRSVRDKQYKYIRNYQWWKPYAQNINYMNEMPTMQEWRRLAAAGKLNATQSLFMAPQKPREELYDCNADPYEVNNLAADPKYADVLDRLRKAHVKWTEDIHDLGYLPESVLLDYMDQGKNWRDESDAWKTSAGLRKLQVEADVNPFKIPDLPGDPDDPFLIRLAELAGRIPLIKDPGVAESLKIIIISRSDDRCHPLELDSLFRHSRGRDGLVDEKTMAFAKPRLSAQLKSDNQYIRHAAALVIDDLGPQAVEFADDIRAMLKKDNGYAARVGEFILSTREAK